MDVGIGLPNSVPGVDRAGIVDWARRAEAAGFSSLAFRRAASHADGWTQGGGTPEQFDEAVGKLRTAWEAAGRTDEPRTMALFYFALGDRAEEQARTSLDDYYGYLGEYAPQVADSAAKDEDSVRRYLAGFEAAGVDEVVCFPTSPDPQQVDLLADVVRG